MSRRRRIKKKKSRKRLAYGVIAVTFIFLCFLTYFSLRQSNQTPSDHTTPPQVAIVDHLNFTGQPNPTFVNACMDILEEGDLTWKYYRGEDVTVDFYRNLPSYGTSLIILRVHSAIMKTPEGIVSILGLFTSERYYGFADAYSKYPDDVLHDRLVNATFPTGVEAYFGIVPKFVEESMSGKFKDTVVIMMGCEGLGYVNPLTNTWVKYTDMAEAFRKRGAKVYIGWNGPISVNHTDQETLDLIRSLILEKRTIRKAVEEVDPDPYYKSELKFYPSGAENYTIPNVGSSLTMNVALLYPTPRTPKRFK